MKKIYKIPMLALVALLCFANASFAQRTEVKTITIINGDTTISENNIGEKEIADMEKQLDIEINGDSITGKKMVKKIIMNDDNREDNNAFAYAFNDDKDTEIEVSNDENGNKTKIIIRNDGKKSDSRSEKKVIHKSISTSGSKTSEENMNVNINIKNTTASIRVESGNDAPLNISILNEDGKQVFYDSQKNGKNYNKEIKLEKKGIYFLNLIQNKKSTTEKIIVE